MIYQVLGADSNGPYVMDSYETWAQAEKDRDPGEVVVETRVSFCPAALRPYPQVAEKTYGGLTSAQLAEKQLPAVLAHAWDAWLSAKAAQGDLDEAGQGPPEAIRWILDGRPVR